jgi:hypothetical protein
LIKFKVKNRKNLSKINGFNGKAQAGSFWEIVNLIILWFFTCRKGDLNHLNSDHFLLKQIHFKLIKCIVFINNIT